MEKNIQNILDFYDLKATCITKEIDTSRGDKDLRFNYIIDDKYVLKVNTNKYINEEYLCQISDLILRYESIGVYSPKYIKNKENFYITKINKFKENTSSFNCYIEEFSKYKIANEVYKEDKKILFKIKKDSLYYTALLAKKYSNFSLIENKSPFTLIDLHYLDVDVDEKKSNLNSLLDTLESINESILVNKIKYLDEFIRKEIIKNYKALPRCVFQGDLNSSNLLTNEKGEFKGIIDFNLCGTDVNINYFINECMGESLTEFHMKNYEVNEIIENIYANLRTNLKNILSEYSLNKLEENLFPFYESLIVLSYYPYIVSLNYYLRENEYRDKALEYIKEITYRIENTLINNK